MPKIVPVAPVEFPVDFEDRTLNARTKLAALEHLFSQYRGELQFTDEAAHGVALLLDDIKANLEEKGGA